MFYFIEIEHPDIEENARMISDVLFDAIDQIKGYQEHLPQVYADLEKQINLVVAAMDWLRAELDKAPEAEADADVDLEVLRDGDQVQHNFPGGSDPAGVPVEEPVGDQPNANNHAADSARELKAGDAD